MVVDERLREREFGVLDGLTRRGITAQYPEESARRAAIGKFYHRPPGGESWVDVAQRLRAVLDEIRMDARGERVLLMGHQVVVLLTRYVVEGMDEATVLGHRPRGRGRQLRGDLVRARRPRPAGCGSSATTRWRPSRSRTSP